MTEKLYPIEEIDAYIAHKPSPEYDEFQRAVDDAFNTLLEGSFITDDVFIDILKDIVSYDGIDNEQKSLTEASSEFFGRLDEMMAQVPRWCGPTMWRMLLDYDMTDVHDFLVPCMFIKPEAYAHMVSTWDKLHEHAVEMYMRAEDKVKEEMKR